MDGTAATASAAVRGPRAGRQLTSASVVAFSRYFPHATPESLKNDAQVSSACAAAQGFHELARLPRRTPREQVVAEASGQPLLLAARVLRVLRCCPMAAVSSSARSRSRSRTVRQQGEALPADKLVEAIIHLLEAGTTSWRRQWYSSGGGHHVNLLSGHRYRGANPILLTLGMHLRGSALPYWCGVAEAKALGIFPRKGSQGVRILRPQVNRVAAGTEVAGHVYFTCGHQFHRRIRQERVWVSYRPLMGYP